MEERIGIESDEETGAVTFKGPDLVKSALPILVDLVVNAKEPEPPKAEKPAKEKKKKKPSKEVAKLIDRYSDLYTEITGKAPKGVPILVTASVVAVDNRNMKAVYRFQGLMDVPKAKVIRAVKAWIKEKRQGK